MACSIGCTDCQFNVTSSLEICLNCNINLGFTLQSSACVCAVGTLLNGTTCISITNTTNSTNTTNGTNSTNSNNTNNIANNTNNTVNICGNGVL